MTRVCITGATGFIGKQLVSSLLQKKFTLRVLVRDPHKASFFPTTVEVRQGDLTDANTLATLCDDIDIVFHLGGYAHAAQKNNPHFVQLHHNINLQGTKNIINEAIRANVKKFIFFSSVKAVADTEVYIDETWEQPPHSPYGIAKREAEKIVLSAKNTGMHVCVLRPALVYGPHWKGNLDNMLRAIHRGLFPALPETHNRRSMISLDDICQAALLAAIQPQANGKIYFVTDEINYSTRQLYVLMCQALGKRVPRWFIPWTFFKGLATIGDLSKKYMRLQLPFNSDVLAKLFSSAHYNSTAIKHDLGFQPSQRLETVLPRIIAAYGEQLKINKGN